LTCQLAVVRESFQLRRQLAILLLDVELLERLRDQGLQAIQLVGRERLLDVVVRALAHGLDGRIDSGLSGHDDAFRGDGAKLKLLQQCKAVHLRHLEIGEHHAIALRTELVERLLAIDGHRDFVAFVAQDRAQTFRDGAVVVRYQDSGVRFLRFWNGSYPRARLII